ncbi:hypothetical protein B0O99DRAFT_690185 [Bisporella sp. PMI_857]|nr:hypothetical protein B0O99DRAFT_690185 [Bisporella sp. PMI_857]
MDMIFLLVAERKYWQRMEFHPEVRPTLEYHLGTEQRSEWRTKGFFRRHLTKPNLSMFESRTNDLIILADATKPNPLLPEACMVFGANKKRIGVRTEPKDPDLENKELADGIWDRVEKVNKGRWNGDAEGGVRSICGRNRGCV